MIMEFRIWDKTEKKMTYSSEYKTLKDYFDYRQHIIKLCNGIIDMQYTGFKAHYNNTKIFEGDNIEWSAPDTRERDEYSKQIRVRDVVAFSSGCFKTEKRGELLFGKMAPHKKVRVVGNKYENKPEEAKE